MNLEAFSAGAWRRRYHYQSFEPASINHEWVWEDAAINTLLESAARALAELNAFSLIVPDIDLFIEMHVVKEAQTSSRIEGGAGRPRAPRRLARGPKLYRRDEQRDRRPGPSAAVQSPVA
jgi:hypothetical protein